MVEAFTGEGVRRASGMPSVAEALGELAAGGFEEVAIASLHLVESASHRAAERDAAAAAGRFSRLALARPLLDGPDDAARLAAALDRRHTRRAHRAVVVVGHGTRAAGQSSYDALERALARRGRTDMVLGLMQGSGDRGLEEVASRLAERRRAGELDAVLLVPLLLTAGAHVERELDGAPHGWRARLEAAGLAVDLHREGLATDSVIRRLATGHLLRALGEPGGASTCDSPGEDR